MAAKANLTLVKPDPPPVPPARSLVDDIDELQGRLNARLDELVDEDAEQCPGIPKLVLRQLLLRNGFDFFAAMRRLLIERGG